MKTQKKIAEDLKLKRRTVESYIASIKEKLNVVSLDELVEIYSNL